jgi:DNA-binding NarL/FixJ family response regulator
MFQRAWIHVAASTPEDAARIACPIQRYATVRIVCEPRPAVALSTPRFAGAIVVLDGCPASVAGVIALRRASPRLAILALLREPSPALLDPLQAEGVEVASADAPAHCLVAFVQRALASNFAGTPRVSEAVRGLAARQKLTPRELQLLVYALGDEPRARVRRRLGISENTLKTEIRGLIRKCGARNADALAKQVLREALGLPAGANEDTEVAGRRALSAGQ